MKEIKAKEGMYLTQAAEVGKERVFITAIMGLNINESDWRDAISEEKYEFEKAQEKEAE